MTASNFSEIMKAEANKLAGKTKEEPPVLSTEDQEIKQLEDKKERIEKEGRLATERESREYRAEQNWEKEDKDHERNRSC